MLESVFTEAPCGAKFAESNFKNWAPWQVNLLKVELEKFDRVFHFRILLKKLAILRIPCCTNVSLGENSQCCQLPASMIDRGSDDVTNCKGSEPRFERIAQSNWCHCCQRISPYFIVFISNWVGEKCVFEILFYQFISSNQIHHRHLVWILKWKTTSGSSIRIPHISPTDQSVFLFRRGSVPFLQSACCQFPNLFTSSSINLVLPIFEKNPTLETRLKADYCSQFSSSSSFPMILARDFHFEYYSYDLVYQSHSLVTAKLPITSINNL